MTISPYSRPVHLSREATETLSSLKPKVDRCKRLGYDDLAWDYSAAMIHTVNRSTLHLLDSGTFTSDDLLMFCEVAESYEKSCGNIGKKGIHLNLALIEGSPLAGEIIEMLKKYMNEGEITHE
jgi:hypothetical protein